MCGDREWNDPVNEKSIAPVEDWDFSTRHPSVAAIMPFFTYDHLPERLQYTSRKISELALQIVVTTPDNSELTTGLRKLLEAKDCFVRANL